ncbi:PREDICTED: putative F-box protein At3g10240 [Theobroma cacao]|uniref:F-box protein At3g10240 n=1 Tax=Theobroma cacao TaxID=3641 RepID=A0AB32X1V3_THECC|nr:PREDICTED: putative F-box protein At3g10240 [Theobroma cacao]
MKNCSMLMPITYKELPETLVMEILLMLPVKSLMRFKCVCKTWCSSFRTSYFITNHKKNNLNLLIWYVDKVPRYSLFSIETKIKKHGGPGEFNLKVKENIHIPTGQTGLGLCNGLLCLHDSYRITLWNPSTREVKLLPKSTISSPPSTSHTSFYCIGFGGLISKIIFQIHLYSLNTDSWREIRHPNVYIYAPELFSTYLNEIYHWKAIDDDVGDLILSFDMAEDVFSTLPLPNFGMSNDECLWHITSFNEAAAVTVSPTTGMENKYDIWVLSGHSWTKQLTIGSIFGRPLAFWKNGELLLESENDTLVMFDTCTGELQDFGITCLSTQGS